MAGALRKVKLQAKEGAAEALRDDRHREAVGRLVDRCVRSGAEDPLPPLLERTAAQAEAAGFTDEDLDAELADCNAERRG